MLLIVNYVDIDMVRFVVFFPSVHCLWSDVVTQPIKNLCHLCQKLLSWNCWRKITGGKLVISQVHLTYV